MNIPWRAIGRYTVGELKKLFEEKVKQDERQLRREAEWVAHLMNATGHYKPAVTADRLLGKPGPNRQERADMRARARAAMEAKRKSQVTDASR